MKIEEYLNTQEFKTRGQLVKETGFTDRTVRQAISDLKKKIAVIYNSQTRGYRLAKDIKSFNTVEEAEEEKKQVQHCINDIEARKKDFNMSEKNIYSLYEKVR